MKKIFGIIIILLFISQALFALEMTELIDCPTAGILQKGEVKFPISIFDKGGVSFGAGVGVLPKLMFGIQYGGEYIIGDSIPEWDSYPGVFVKYRIFDESPKLPAIAIGFDSRGFGTYTDSLSDGTEINRFAIKSKGFYAVVSRNFHFLGNLGLHGGVSYSTEWDDNDDNLNFFVGLDKSINQHITLLVEYDFAFNDNGKSGDEETYSFGEGNGYLNAAILLNIAQNIRIQINFRDFLGNQYVNPDRSISIGYFAQL